MSTSLDFVLRIVLIKTTLLFLHFSWIASLLRNREPKSSFSYGKGVKSAQKKKKGAYLLLNVFTFLAKQPQSFGKVANKYRRKLENSKVWQTLLTSYLCFAARPKLEILQLCTTVPAWNALTLIWQRAIRPFHKPYLFCFLLKIF